MRGQKKGFALIVSLSLLAFLLLLMLALATLVRVELSSASLDRAKAEAQQNALLGLQVALAELQTLVGPDQRVTARGDLEYGASAANKYWTGVYGSSIEPDYNKNPVQIATDRTDPTKISTTGSTARILNWLVSGNESTAFDPSTNIGSKGNVVTDVDPNSISFLPNLTISGIADTSDPTAQPTPANSTDVTIGGEEARILVGPGSVSESADYVVAPLVKVENGSRQGGYAWWVGDEGVKASANLPMETDDADKFYAFTNSQRNAIELMADGTEDETYLSAARIEELYDPMTNRLESVESISELNLLSTDQDEFSDVLKHRFHDISPRTKSVLSDSYAGGLKKDLSILLDESYNSTARDDSASRPAKDVDHLWVAHPDDPDQTIRPGYAIPTWKHLRTFYQTRVPNTAFPAIEAQHAYYDNVNYRTGDHINDDHVGVSPVLTHFTLGFRVAADGNQLEMRLFPLVVLWNPYNFTIQSPADGYEVGIYPAYATDLDVQVYIDIQNDPDYADYATANPSVSHAWVTVATADLAEDSDRAGGDEYVRFRLEPTDIPPGQSLIFTLPSGSDGDYTQQNVMVNAEPEPAAYVSFKLPKAYENGVPPLYTIPDDELNLDYRVVTMKRTYQGNIIHDGRSFANNGGGQTYTYLGAPSNSSRIRYSGGDDAQNDAYQNPMGPWPWYSAYQNVDWQYIDVLNYNADVIIQRNLDKNPPATGQLFEDLNQSVIQDAGTLTSFSSVEPAFMVRQNATFSAKDSNGPLFNSNQMIFPVRWIAQENMRATRTGRTNRDLNFVPTHGSIAGNSFGSSQVVWHSFNSQDGENSHRASAGQSHDWENGEPVDAVLFEFLPDGYRPHSIGQLQHANLSFLSAYPSYPIGNSLADFRLHSNNGSAPAGWQLTRRDKIGSNVNFIRDHRAYYDISYLLNRTLWDQYFFSSIDPQTSDLNDLTNEQMEVIDTTVDVTDPEKVSAALMLEGGFNINSTSEQAWRAILSGNYNQEYSQIGNSADRTTDQSVSFPRFTKPLSGDSANNPWGGFRSLNEEQVAQLARNIVDEVKFRGPFTSVSDFVNRRLVDNLTTGDTQLADGTGYGTFNENEIYGYEELKGPLQAALDRTLVDATSGTNVLSTPINDPSLSFWQDDFVVNEVGEDNTSLQGSQFSQGAYNWHRIGSTFKTRPVTNLTTFAPNFITQADVLSVIGGKLTARSDTFVIRAYGESGNSFGNKPMAQAWCEVVVQRYPDYINDAENSFDTPALTENEHFNRQFKIVSFRWLSTEEI